MALQLRLILSSPSWRMTALSNTLAGVLVPFGLVQAAGVERIAPPVASDAGLGSAIGVRVKEASERLACMENVLDSGTMPCPQDCMIPTNQLGMTNADSCALAVAGNWQCRWPTQWVTEQENCNNLGYGAGWTGVATVRREYQIQQCGQVVTRTGAPPQLLETSQCNRIGSEPRSVACPDRANASLASDIGGAVGALWTQATSHETDWSGSVGLQRSYNEGLTPQGQIVRLSSSDWSVTPGGVACTRIVDRQVKVPCKETIRVTAKTCHAERGCESTSENILIGDTNYACLTDYRANSITYSPGLTVDYGDVPYGTTPFLRKARDWSYTATSHEISSNCTAVTGPYNSGVAKVTQKLEDDLLTHTVVSSQEPALLQEYCSQKTMTSGWTTYVFTGDGGDGSDGGSDSDSGGGGSGDCGCGDGGSSGGGSDCGGEG